jgi:hypothetical protein
MIYKFEFTAEEVNLIGFGLGKLSIEMGGALYGKFIAEVKNQEAGDSEKIK